MSIRQPLTLGLLTLGTVSLVTVALVARQQAGRPMRDDAPMAGRMMTSDSKMTRAQKIANAMSAAPATVSAKAKILDWPASEGVAPEVLREGGNAWTCLPDMPETKGNDPMCLDAAWMLWVDAYLAHKSPAITGVGIGYMLAPGGAWGSNTDPYAMAETRDNHWGHHNPHVMILVPDVKTLAAISTDPANGGPYVMFAGTPYAHIMAPTSAMAMPMAAGH